MNICAALSALALLTLVADSSGAMAAKVQMLHFSTATTPEHEAIKALMDKESGVTIDDKWLSIAPLDLDLDGIPEYFAMAVNTDYFCGDAGCRPELFKRQGTGWTEIPLGLNEFTNSELGDWSVERKPEYGHLVLVLTESKFKTRYLWDGTAYSSAE